MNVSFVVHVRRSELVSATNPDESNEKGIWLK